MNFRKILNILLSTILCINIIIINTVNSKAISYYDDQIYDFETLVSDYIYIYDLTNQRVVYQRNGDQQFYPASLTKMMTLILGIENIDDYQQKVFLDSTIFDGLIEAQASRAGFGVNDEVSYMDLFYGILLPSGAECTRAIAYNVAGSEEAFVDLMNQKASELGMDSTHFVNDTGLHDENHYSSAADMAKLLAYCSENELFMTILSTQTYTSEPTATYINGLAMESTLSRYCTRIYEGACPSLIIGAKSGFTNPALYCLASIADINNTRYIMITGHAQWEDLQHNNVTDHINTYLALENDNYQYFSFASSCDTLIETKVGNTFNEKLIVNASEDIDGYYPANATFHILVNNEISAPIYQGDQVGYYYIESDGQILKQAILESGQDIEVNDMAVKYEKVLTFLSQYHKQIIVILTIIIIIMLSYIIIVSVLLAKRKKRIRQLRKQRALKKEQERENNKEKQIEDIGSDKLS